MKKTLPSTNGNNGRDQTGRFTKGNPGGPGNPFARKVSMMRRVMLDAVSEKDLRAIVQTLVVKAKEGDTAAIKILFDRTIGKATQALDPDRLELEELELAKLVKYARPRKYAADIEKFGGDLLENLF